MLVLLVLLAVGLTGRHASAPSQELAPASGRREHPRSVAPTARLGAGERLLQEYLGLAEPSELHALGIMLATLPDPRASRLDWMFDSHLDAIFRAFERAGYVADRFVLPWEDQPEKSERVLLGKPGVLLFRRRVSPGDEPDLWLVYVIGELSTGGIDQVAFHRALDERAKLFGTYTPVKSPRAGGKDLLPLLGPVFSGSSSSLRRALDAELAPGGLLVGAFVQVVSGAATSPAGIAGDQISFQTTLHTDQTLLEALGKVLDSCGWSPRQLAILQESTTAYGRTGSSGRLDKNQEEPLYIPFPMNIGSLRRAASRQGGRSGAAKEDAETLANIGLDLDEDARPENPSPASKLSAPSVELLLEEITRMLAQHDIRVALLFATDVRDKLFLGKELKKRRPDLQLVTTEGNVLYLRPDYNQWLRGMIVLSTYPLLLRDSAWRRQSNVPKWEQLMFSNEGAEGTFNAALFQLRAIPGDPASPVPVADYGHPTRVDAQPEIPPVWATVVGASTMLPLSVFPESKREPGDPRARTPVPITTVAPSETTQAQDEAPRDDEPDARAEHSFLALLTVAGLSLYLLGHASVRVWKHLSSVGFVRALLPDRARVEPIVFAESQQLSLSVHQEFYAAAWYLVFVGLLFPGLCLIQLQWSGIEVGAVLTFPATLGWFAIGTAGVAAAWHVGRLLMTAARHRPRFDLIAPRIEGYPAPWRGLEAVLRAGTCLIGLLYLVSIVWWSVSLLKLDAQLRPLFLHRALELDQGVSPFVPLFLLGGLLLAWCQWHRRRIDGLALREPMETLRLCEHGFGMGERVRACLFLVSPTGFGFLLLLAFALSILWCAPQFPGVLDALVLSEKAPLFAALLHFGVLGAIAASVWAAYRLWTVWRAFEHGLPGADLVAGLPLQEVSKEHGFTANLGLWPTGRIHGLSSAAARRWRALLRANGSSTPELESALKARAAPRRRWSPELERATGALWEWFHATKGEEAEKAVGEVLVLELMLYVEWALDQIRTLSLFLLLSIVLTTMLIASYPFQPQHLIQTVSLLVFFGTVATLVIVIGSMNRHPTLSHLANTEPNQLTWDRTLFVNLGLYLAVPLLTLASAQNPALRGLLFEWIDPLLKSLATS